MTGHHHSARCALNEARIIVHGLVMREWWNKTTISSRYMPLKDYRWTFCDLFVKDSHPDQKATA